MKDGFGYFRNGLHPRPAKRVVRSAEAIRTWRMVQRALGVIRRSPKNMS